VPYATEADAMGLPPFGRGLALLCNAVAGTEWRAQRTDPATGIGQRVPDQPRVLVDPYPGTTPWGYRWAACEDLILYGNHFADLGDPDDRTARPGSVWPIPAEDVWITTDPARPWWWEWCVAGTMVDRFSLLHVSAGAKSGSVLGRGVLAQYAEWLGGSVAAERHAGAYFAGGALPPAILQAPQVLTQVQADELKAKWRAMTSTREPVVLPTGYVLTPVVSNAESAQLVESRQWNAAAVAMILGIPSYKLGLPGPTMTYQNVESADIEFVRDSVDRYGAPLVAAFSKWLMPHGTEVAWDYTGRMRADAKSTAEVLTTYTGAGILLVDEARAALGRAPLPADAPEPDDSAPAELEPPDDTAPDPTTPADGRTDHV
jgi:phage portal protein BeeE